MSEEELKKAREYPWWDERLWLGYYSELKEGNTNMGYEQWKLTSEVLNNER